MPKTAVKRKPVGRPTKRSPQVLKDILATASTGLPVRYAAVAGGISLETLGEWRAADPEFAREFELARLESVKRRWDLIQKAAVGTDKNPGDWKAAAWSLERTAAHDFARPEFQLAVQQNNVVVNELSININATEYEAIEEVSLPVRETVGKMFQAYRPELGNANVVKVMEVEARSVDKPAEPPIECKSGEEKRPAFWAQFVGNSGRLVSKECAIFVAKTIVDEVLGFGWGNQAIVAFEGKEPIAVSDVLAVIEKHCGGSPAGFQLLQKKAGFTITP